MDTDASKVRKTLKKKELKRLKSAKKTIENVSVLMKGMNSVGSGIESGIKILPQK